MAPDPSPVIEPLNVFPAFSAVPKASPSHVAHILAGLEALIKSEDGFNEGLHALGLMPLPLIGRKVLVTGSARMSYPETSDGRTLFGIGDAVAEAMIQNGASVVLNSFTDSMSPVRLESLRRQTIMGQVCEYQQGDLSTWEGAQKLVKDSYALLDGLDVLVLNAGTFIEENFLDLTQNSYSQTMNLNHRSAIAAMQAYCKLLGTEGEGRIVVTSSINARLGEPGHAVYDGSKAALEASIRAIALDLAAHGYKNIAVNGVAPGLIYTPLTYEAVTKNPADHARLGDAIPMGLAYPDALVQHYVHLARRDCSYMTGTILDASGGLAIRQAT